MLLGRTILTLAFAAASALAADAGLLNLLSSDPAMISDLNVEAARGSAFGQRVLAQMKSEDANFQKLIEATGFDPRKDLYEVLVASNGKTGLVLARGSFQPTKITALLTADGSTSTLYMGVEIWSKKDGTLAVAMPDTSLALFGPLDLVKAAIARRAATKTALSADLQKKIAAWSSYDAWFVSTIGLSDLGVNATGKNEVLPSSISTDMIRSGAAGASFGKDVKLAGSITTRSNSDAEQLVDTYRFLLSLVQLNADKQNAAEVLKVAESATVAANGANVTFAVTIPESMLDVMLQKKGTTARQARVL
jgi:hypothetical protein